MIIEIEPLDTLFFRDGKPFSMGDDTWATGMFPPHPSVLYGVLRSAYLGQYNVPLEDIEERTKDLRIHQIWYNIETQKGEKLNYLPQPLDLVQETELNRKQKLQAEKYFNYDTYKLAANSVDFPSHLSSFNYENVLVYDEEKGGQSEKDSILSTTNYKKYLKGASKSSFKSSRMGHYHQSEPKIGISRNNSTSTAAEGNLYRVGMIRANAIKIRVEFTGLVLKDEGILGIGAESKLAAYSVLDESIHKLDWTISSLGISKSKNFKICLTTPAIFENGYYPIEIFKKASVKVKLITCTVGNFINIGGFDMKERQPKVMQRAVPAGSTYYYELLDGELQDLENAIEEFTVSEYKGEEGFGIAFIGQV